jgi:hypothetical protein
MKTTSMWNDLSDETRKMIPEMKGAVVFQMLNGQKNNDPDEAQRRAYPILYGKTQLPTQYRILDKNKKNKDGEKVGGWVDVILAKDWAGENPQGAKCFVAGINDSMFGGKFELNPNKSEDVELYEILWLSPKRKDSPFAEGKPLYEIVDAATATKQTNSKVETLRDALNKAAGISDELATKIAASKNQTFSGPNSAAETKAWIGQFAKETPDKFLEAYGDGGKNESTEIKATLKLALDKKIISLNQMDGKVTMGESLLTTLQPTKEGFDLLTELASWANSAVNGQAVLEGIKKQLSKK